MNFLTKLSRFLTPRRNQAERFKTIYVKCNRCGEKIRARVDLWNELSPDYEGNTLSYISRKVMMGAGHCFQQIEVQLRFDGNRRLVDEDVTGGEAIEKKEFEAQTG